MENRIYRLIFTDGRWEYLLKTYQSFMEKMSGVIAKTIIIDDSGDAVYAGWLDDNFGAKVDLIVHHPSRIGYCRSVQQAWLDLPGDCTHVQHLEDDFVLEREVDLNDMIFILDNNPHLSQVWLMRHPWYQVEKDAGSVYLHHGAGAWQEMSMSGPNRKTVYWVEQAGRPAYWTMNPCLYSSKIVELGFPGPPLCEQAFGKKVAPLRSAFLGRPTDPPYTLHIGHHTDARMLTSPVNMAEMVKGF